MGRVVRCLDEQPELYPDLVCYWTAFRELNMTRRVAWQAEPISFTDILSWLILNHVDQDD